MSDLIPARYADQYTDPTQRAAFSLAYASAARLGGEDIADLVSYLNRAAQLQSPRDAAVTAATISGLLKGSGQ